MHGMEANSFTCLFADMKDDNDVEPEFVENPAKEEELENIMNEEGAAPIIRDL